MDPLPGVCHCGASRSIDGDHTATSCSGRLPQPLPKECLPGLKEDIILRGS